MRRARTVLLLALAGCSGPPPAPAPPSGGKAFLGVSGLGLDRKVPGGRYTVALTVDGVVPGAPAEAAGLLAGDRIVGATGVDFPGDPETLPDRFRQGLLRIGAGGRLGLTVVRDRIQRTSRVDGAEIPEPKDPGALLREKPPGARYVMEARRKVEVLELEAVLGEPPAFREIPPDAQIFPHGWDEGPEVLLAREAVRRLGWGEAVSDLERRLAACTERPDFWRMDRAAYAVRNPWKLAALARGLARDLGETQAPADRLSRAAEWAGRPFAVPGPRFPDRRDLAACLDWIQDALEEASRLRARAFGRLTAEDLAFLDGQLDALFADPEASATFDPRFRRLGEQVDFALLYRAAAVLADALCDPALPGDLARALEAAGKTDARRETPWGDIVVAGTGDDWHKEDAAVLVDLGGDDFHSAHAGGSSLKRPVCAVLDCGGDDAYESTQPWSQACGKLGVGILIDAGGGNDAYLGQDWAQGVSCFGAALLVDGGGDDRYRGGDYVQGAAFCGLSLLLDAGGDDQYSATAYAQACGMPAGLALLLDGSGDDAYFAKGRHPTGYGDAGLFDAMSQGCGLGFREARASGGIALLLDRAGDDRYEAGHFSQGGGYYYGWGSLRDEAGDDAYLGSRYAQGFSAHQAAGAFEDVSGNDRYDTLHAVAQGLAWDESVSVFTEGGGDDLYLGGTGFSQGSSAHNAFILFLDRGGRDRYRAGGRLASGPNDYHGGESLAVLIDAGGELDAYEGAPEAPGDGNARIAPPHAMVLDLPGPLESADLEAMLPKK